MYNSSVLLDPSDGTSKRFSVPVVQELVANSQLHSPPRRYIRSDEERPSLACLHPHPQSHIPVIDMALLSQDPQHHSSKQEMEKLVLACQDWGFFQVVNHAIPRSLTERMKGITREFFELPLEEKLKYEVQEREGYGQAFVASDDQKLDWADIFSLTTLPPQNRKMDFWPTKPVDFREIVDLYASEVQILGNKMLEVLAEGCGLKADTFINIYGKTTQIMRMNYYPPCPRPDLVLGLTPHSDGAGLTVLLQDDDTIGLHIRKDGEWFPVQPIPDALVINIGDALEVMSNGKYPSIEHRAVTNADRNRISIAMFYGPSIEKDLGPVPELIDELHPCKYRTITRDDFLLYYLSGKLDGKKKIDFFKIP